MEELDAYVKVNDVVRPLPEPATLAQVIACYSPFGAEPVLATYEGVTYRSIDDLSGIAVQSGMAVELFPLIIGG